MAGFLSSVYLSQNSTVASLSLNCYLPSFLSCLASGLCSYKKTPKPSKSSTSFSFSTCGRRRRPLATGSTRPQITNNRNRYTNTHSKPNHFSISSFGRFPALSLFVWFSSQWFYS
mmetsp:Transcript_9514/g.28360  ORF Transcript_9514/g.28360 Transcript_9514/m.28360 type:complete len:115 (+) Transcript_9514:327-671(+)